MNAALDDARKQWQAGEPLVAGQLLFEAVPTSNIAEWSLRILDLAMKWIPAPSPVRRLAKIKGRWSLFSPTPRQHFEAIRNLTMKLDALESRSQSEVCISNLCYLAENIAKVLANSRNRSDEPEFDEDSGWWIVSCLYACAKCVGSQQFFDECEQLLFSEMKHS